MDYQPWSAEAERDLAREMSRKAETTLRKVERQRDALLAALEELEGATCDYMALQRKERLVVALHTARLIIASAKGDQ